MAADAPAVDLDAVVARLGALDDPDARARVLDEAVTAGHLHGLAERLKAAADRARYQDTALSLRLCGDLVALGTRAAAPTVVALGRMAEAAALHVQGRYREALARCDEAAALFRAAGDEAGWARTQIGGTVTCMALARFDEALARAHEARAILERAGDALRVASIDNNLALVLERMNRPAEALTYSERALAAYRGAASSYYAVHTLGNHALLLWRVGRVREALQAHQEARQGYAALGAAADAAREDLNIGTVYLVLGHYADAADRLSAARRDLGAAAAPYLSAWAGLHLAGCYVRLGRFREAVELAASLRDELGRHEAAVDVVQALTWQALAHAGLHEHDAALRALDGAAQLLAAGDTFAAHRAALDCTRAQLLLAAGRMEEARHLLAQAIPALRAAGLTMEVAAAQVLWGGALLEEGRAAEAADVAAEALAVAEREGLDWLAARALHLRGRVGMRQGDGAGAREALAAAARRLDRVHRHMAWDDRIAYGGDAALYADALTLALEQGRPAVALRYAERSKARALADHLRARIDVRPRVRDERSRLLIDEMERLRERYAWLGALRPGASGEASATVRPGVSAEASAAVRWSPAPFEDAGKSGEAVRIERRMVEIWRELQVGNPAYRGEAAALDLADGEEVADDEEAAERWVDRLHAVLGASDDAALLEYAVVGDDLVLFVVRAGRVNAMRLAGADAAVRRLVPLLRLNVERSAAASAGGATFRALSANARGVLGHLHAALLAPAAALLDGAARLLVVPHGAGHHVPFHALHDGHGFLLESAEVTYAPCSGLVEHFDERQRIVSAAGNAGEALVLACSNGGALSHVESEGRDVVAALGGRLLCEEGATLGALRRHAGGCRVLHLAAHACFRPDEPLFSSLQLCDGRLSTLEVFDLELSCSLATLSACETALGTAGAGDELMGLSRAFLYAGAPSLVLSLWKVADCSTAALMRRMYEGLRSGERKAAALRQAQLALLHGDVDDVDGVDGADYSAPFYWAPFVLIGHAGRL